MINFRRLYIFYVLIFILFLLYHYKSINTYSGRDATKSNFQDELEDQQVLNQMLKNKLDYCVFNNQLRQSQEEYQNQVLLSDLNQNELFNKYKKPFNPLIESNEKYFINIAERKAEFSSNEKFHLIVEYTKIGGTSKYCHKNLDKEMLESFDGLENVAKPTNSTEYFDMLDMCEYKNCFFSCDKSLASQADALLFHEGDLNNDLSTLLNESDEKIYNSIIGHERPSSQKWILWNDEANRVSKTIDIFKFNWTMSYKRPSEASYCAYGCYRKLKKITKHNTFVERIRMKFLKRKSNSLWFVSNCGSKYRNRFVSELSQHASVSIYGTCGETLKSENPSINLEGSLKSDECKRDSPCELELFESNKFFLALENQNCSDYITEKFWRSLSFDLIPVVIQPNKEFYMRIAPENSFIHAADFEYDLKKLGDHLNKVADNFDLYFSYLKWKRFYYPMYKGEVVEKLRICELCYRMNTHATQSYYNSVSNFFNQDCQR